MTQTVHIILPLPGIDGFDYSVPEEMALAAGDLAEVPFRHKMIVGVVWGAGSGNVALAKLKPVAAKFDAPPIAEPLRKLVDRVADYTMSPRGAVLKMVLPVTSPATPLTPPPYYLVNTENLKRITPERQRVIDLFADHQPRQLKTIATQAEVSMATVIAMRKAWMLEPVAIESATQHAPFAIKLPELTGAQKEAATQLINTAHGYHVTLLDGVTGSGKTEVYFALIAEILQKQQGQILIMLPEIILTSQLLKRFEARFGFIPATWHSGMSPKARKTVWQGITSGSERLIIGARSALFLPFANLSLIIIDEEHESAFKQEEGVLYHARDMAVLRAFIEKIPLLLASATPSLETLTNCHAGKFARLHLPSRHGSAGMAEMKVIDMRKEALPRNQFLSEPLKKALAVAYEQKAQSMLFLNRRGYAPLTLCRGCGHRMTCPNCSSCLVEHRSRRILKCHHCDYTIHIPKTCPNCQEEDSLIPCGPGVERITEEIAAYLPNARLMMMTRDTVTSSEEAEQMVSRIINGEVDIIIGTQMIAKGHHFPSLTVVGVVDADLGLAGGDLRAAERTYQLLHQVSGRAGRESEKGLVLLQSYMPENSIIQALIAGDRDAFMQAESDSRQLAGMPPFSRLAGIIISGSEEQVVMAAAKQLARLAPAGEGVEILGPAPALLYLLRGKYRFRLLVKAERHVNIQRYIRFWFEQGQMPSGIRVKVDIDPYHFF